MKQSDQELSRSYTRISSFYDETRFGVPFLEEFVLSALLELLDLQEGMRVLDVAAGTGRTAVPLAELGVTVMAMDLTWAMIARMRSKAQQTAWQNLHIQQANARRLPFPDHTFDAVLSLRFFHLFPVRDQMALLHEMHRVVKPGGMVLVEYTNAGSFLVGRVLQDASRRLRRKKPLSRTGSSQIQDLYRDYPIVRRQGFSLPFIGAVARISPGVARWLLEFSMRDGVSRYSRFMWIVSTKSDLEGIRT